MHMDTVGWPHSRNSSHRGYLQFPLLSRTSARPGLTYGRVFKGQLGVTTKTSMRGARLPF
ncbi:MAG: hypothetical protein AB7D06_01680 [Pedobacter sp.]